MITTKYGLPVKQIKWHNESQKTAKVLVEGNVWLLPRHVSEFKADGGMTEILETLEKEATNET